MAAIVDSTPPSRLWNKGKVGVGRVKVHFDVKHNQSYKRTALNIFGFLDSILFRGCPIVMMQVSTEEVEFVGSSNLTLQPLYRVVCISRRHIFFNSRDQPLSKWESAPMRHTVERACEQFRRATSWWPERASTTS